MGNCRSLENSLGRQMSNHLQESLIFPAYATKSQEKYVLNPSSPRVKVWLEITTCSCQDKNDDRTRMRCMGRQQKENVSEELLPRSDCLI